MQLLGDPLLSGGCLSKDRIGMRQKGKRSGRHPLDRISKKVELHVAPIVRPNLIGQKPSLEEWVTKKNRQ